MNNEYKGISFPFRIGGRGGVTMSGRTNTEQQHLKECIKVILGTREFERVMRPSYGLEVLDLFFNDLNETTKHMAIFKINEKLQVLEPRISVRDINIVEEVQPDGSIAHVISLAYQEVDSDTLATLAVTL